MSVISIGSSANRMMAWGGFIMSSVTLLILSSTLGTSEIWSPPTRTAEQVVGEYSLSVTSPNFSSVVRDTETWGKEISPINLKQNSIKQSVLYKNSKDRH